MTALATNVFESVDAVQSWILGVLLDHGTEVSPRGLATREVLGLSFRLRHPRRRCITNNARRFSLPLALGEFAWHMNKADDVASLAYYAKRWSEFADDGRRIAGSCYGRKIFSANADLTSQWDRMLDLLRADLLTRRAMLSLWDHSGLNSSSVDVPCTATIQFLVRSGRVHAVVTMRSNDSIWGLPYDVFLFTMLQEYLAVTLNLELGEYTHFAGSMHLYERHAALAERILRTQDEDFEMPPMAGALQDFLDAESRIRLGDLSPRQELHEYWQACAEVLAWYRDRRDQKTRPYRGLYAPVMRPLDVSLLSETA